MTRKLRSISAVSSGFYQAVKEGWLTKLTSPDRGRHAPLVLWTAYGEETSHHALRNRLSLSSLYYVLYLGFAVFPDRPGEISRW